MPENASSPCVTCCNGLSMSVSHLIVMMVFCFEAPAGAVLRQTNYMKLLQYILFYTIYANFNMIN